MRWMPLVLIGASLWVIVVLTHVAEAFHIFPWMGWGLANSPGHYLDFVSAIGGATFLGVGIAERLAKKLSHNNQLSRDTPAIRPRPGAAVSIGSLALYDITRKQNRAGFE